jgi:virginiamycin B lyase
MVRLVAGQYANLVGRINPENGEITEYTLPQGKAHTVTADRRKHLVHGERHGTIGKPDRARP